MSRLVKAGADRRYPARNTFFTVSGGEGYIHEDGTVDLELKGIDPGDAEKIVQILSGPIDKT